MATEAFVAWEGAVVIGKREKDLRKLFLLHIFLNKIK